MADVKAQFPIGKTQWSKWNDDQRTAFNELCAAGVSIPEAIAGANQTQAKKKTNILDVIEDVAEVAASVSPIIAVAKTVAKATKKKGK